LARSAEAVLSFTRAVQIQTYVQLVDVDQKFGKRHRKFHWSDSERSYIRRNITKDESQITLFFKLMDADFFTGEHSTQEILAIAKPRGILRDADQLQNLISTFERVLLTFHL